ncbi:MAG: excisionase family DNA-binding protein [Bryobacterales bacterium]|nr:excisionase family DNA-binding protein [Bryobacterales bacterium]
MHRLLKEVARNAIAGRAVALVPEKHERTTQGAANLLGVSRPYLTKLLEAGELPYHKAGNHRRICRKDLREYQR